MPIVNIDGFYIISDYSVGRFKGLIYSEIMLIVSNFVLIVTVQNENYDLGCKK
ncbi:protein of unknown function [Shewanella benthica]|uniref:Uncharacterized protein n=1 Tax=Shewanella benthica TaxID=43661 RepID=A0A330LXE4_9GAMM|nr:protein of unknown function [Shewanella benthica]